jgi:hypothetical protein
MADKKWYHVTYTGKKPIVGTMGKSSGVTLYKRGDYIESFRAYDEVQAMAYCQLHIGDMGIDVSLYDLSAKEGEDRNATAHN